MLDTGRNMSEEESQSLISQNCLYGKENILFHIAIKRIIQYPFFGFIASSSLFIYFFVVSYIKNCLYPSSLAVSSQSSHLIKMAIDLRDQSFFIGDKFALFFYGLIVPVSTFVWLRHCLQIHPLALINIAKINRKDVKKHLSKAYSDVNGRWLEYLGICIGVFAVCADIYFFNRDLKWYHKSFLLYFPRVLSVFGLWYILPTFIGKGFILVTRGHFHVDELPDFYFFMADDPFLIEDFMKDVFSVFYFIIVGGFTLLGVNNL